MIYIYYLKVLVIHTYWTFFLWLTAYFLSSEVAQKAIDDAYYSHGTELTWEGKNYLISFINDVLKWKIMYGALQNWSPYVPLVHYVTAADIRANLMVRFLLLCH